MAESIPFESGVPHQELEVTLAGVPNLVEARWNDQDRSFYLSVYEIDGTPIAVGLKVVLGVLLGRKSTHKFFKGRALFAVDNANTGEECRLDDLGGRITIIYLTEADLELASAPPLVIPR